MNFFYSLRIENDLFSSKPLIDLILHIKLSFFHGICQYLPPSLSDNEMIFFYCVLIYLKYLYIFLVE